MKKKIIVMAAACALVLTAVIGKTLAEEMISVSSEGSMSESAIVEEPADRIRAEIDILDLNVALAGGIPSGDSLIGIPVKAMPGETVMLANDYNHGLFVVNEANEGQANGYTSYFRVTIDKQWKDNLDGSLDAGMIELGLASDGKWVSFEELLGEGGKSDDGSKDSEQIILYYVEPIAFMGESTPFLESIYFNPNMNNDYADREVEISFSVEAVQAAVAESAMLSEWGVEPTLDENGTIIGLAE